MFCFSQSREDRKLMSYVRVIERLEKQGERKRELRQQKAEQRAAKAAAKAAQEAKAEKETELSNKKNTQETSSDSNSQQADPKNTNLLINQLKYFAGPNQNFHQIEQKHVY